MLTVDGCMLMLVFHMQDAVKKLELVENNLELAKEFHQIFKLMEQEVSRKFEIIHLHLIHLLLFLIKGNSQVHMEMKVKVFKI